VQLYPLGGVAQHGKRLDRSSPKLVKAAVRQNRTVQNSRISQLPIGCSRPMPDGLVFDRVVKGCAPPDAALLDKYAYTQLVMLRYR